MCMKDEGEIEKCGGSCERVYLDIRREGCGAGGKGG